MADKDNTVYILDSYGLIFRAYFAFISKPLTNSRGENISAIFGFFRNLHWILQHYKPNYLFAAMDSKTKTFRHQMYNEYKATRNKTPDDLHAQIPWIDDILKALGIPVLQCDGYEADDIIATVARLCKEQNRNCKILSGDKDLMQLVTENCQILKPETGGQTWKLTGPEGVEAEWGVKPEQLLDLLSLYGDTADNVPGVRGVGVKTAAKLLTDYKNLDGIYQNISEIKGAMQQKLIDGKEDAYFSQKLIRLCDTVPCPEIQTALDNKPYVYNYMNAAEKLKSYEAFSVAKNYASLGVENNQTSSEQFDKPQASPILNSNNLEEHSLETPLLELKQNDTSKYKPITKIQDLEQYINEYFDFCKTEKYTGTYTNLIAYDSETTSLDTFECELLGFSLCYKNQHAVYIPLSCTNSDNLFEQQDYISKEDAFNQLQRLFTNKETTVIFHNAKFDLKVLINNGFLQDEKSTQDVFINFKAQIVDTMILAWLQNPERNGKNGYSLEYLGETRLGLKGIEFDSLVSKGQTFKDVPLNKAYEYAAEDADFTLQLWKKQQDSLLKAPKELQESYTKLMKLEFAVLPILTQMEITGIHLESSVLEEYNKELTRNLALVEQNIFKEVGHEFNIASTKQLQTVLFEERHLKTGKKTKTGYSTDTSVLEELAEIDPVPRMILEYRELSKLQSTYVETLPKLCDSNGRIHTDFVQTGTATGRLSCREPNLQNIPVRNEEGRHIRSAFTAPQGKVLISADYSQIELVVLAHLSNDKNMSKSFIEGTDVHKATAAMIYNVSTEDVTPQMRRIAKTINFGVIYGMSAFRLAKDLGISRTQSSEFINSYFAQYSNVNNFINQTIQNAEQQGTIQTILGRRRPIININSRNKIEKAAAERIAVNSPVQGSAADIVKLAMINVSNALKETNSPAKLLLQVHDELIFECPDDTSIINQTINLIKDKMENAFKLNVPLKVSIEYGKNWGEFH